MTCSTKHRLGRRPSTALALSMAALAAAPSFAQQAATDGVPDQETVAAAVCAPDMLSTITFPSDAERDEIVQRCLEQELLTAEQAAEIAPDAFPVAADAIDVPQTDTEHALTLANEAPSAEAADMVVERPEGAPETFGEQLVTALGAASIEEALGDAELVAVSDDRIVVARGDNLAVLKDDNALMGLLDSNITTRRYDDGSTVSIVERAGGVRVTTVSAADGQVLRRTRVTPDSGETVLFDDTKGFQPVDLALLSTLDPTTAEDGTTEQSLAPEDLDRGFSLQQVRALRGVRALAPEVELPAVEFSSGSAVIDASETPDVLEICRVLGEMVDANPSEVFLIEGHTDAAGPAAENLALSDRRAEAIAAALVSSGDVPPENIIVQGYGESSLAVQTGEPTPENRRVTVRRITPLLQTAAE